MKTYGLRNGDGEKMPTGKGPNRRARGTNKFTRTNEEGGPRGKHRAAKVGRQKRMVHRQGRADSKRATMEALDG